MKTVLLLLTLVSIACIYAQEIPRDKANFNLIIIKIKLFDH